VIVQVAAAGDVVAATDAKAHEIRMLPAASAHSFERRRPVSPTSKGGGGC